MALAHRTFAARGVARAATQSRRPAVQCRAILNMFNKKETEAASGFYGFSAKDIDGKNVNLSSYKGKVVLVVNTASACGFTPQFEELQGVYDKYKSKGFVVLGFPCNQFGKQDPGSNSQIKGFAKSTYNVTFPLFSKVDVNGASADPLFDYLKSEKAGLFGSQDIKWNFSKFLVNKEGEVVGRYAPTTTPGQLEKEIQKLLAA
ncbi:MAG: glutathione peroxidase [Monoraphidium minutum]|nr:MAG: glutathione peroxidase [Monoraphidium minutum]